MRCFVIAEHDQNHLTPATLATITAAAQLGTVDVLLAGHQAQGAIEQASQVNGVQSVLAVDAPCFAHPVAEDLARVTLDHAEHYDAILAPANTFGKNMLPRVAAKLDVAQISDVTRILGNKCYTRPIFAGNALITLESRDAKQVLTIRTTAFEPAEMGSGRAEIQSIPYDHPQQQSQFVEAKLTQSDRPELGSAKIVISGGRGMQNAENFALIERLADRLGAAVGASRAAVDAGFVPNDYQVGQTGKIIAPDLYWAIGISGAIQHVAGIKDSKVIIAINKDPDAPIFEVADYGLVADFFDILPQIEAELDKLGY